jgi:Holliday junction resolvasome RuvABC DNA-binding subunit
MTKLPTNADVADTLERIADLLEAQNANPFRVRAYREGAQTIRSEDTLVAEAVHEDKLETLTKLPNIGSGIAAVIGEYVTSGKSSLLDDLEAQVSPETVLAKVPGIGKKLAQRIVEQLHIQTLEELEEAAHDGRLAEIEGFGARRVAGVQTALSGMLSRSARSQQRARTSGEKKPVTKPADRPSVELLLAIDSEYRKRAKTGELHKIAPRRFNPRNEAWLPVLNIKRDGWDFTALYSNTAQAHQLGKTEDWVVIYFERNGTEHQQTIVTETKGPLKDKRVVRGRDVENRSYYQVKAKA